VSTIINRYEENIIKEAWNLEFSRWWQMFFIHNRVANIENYKTIIWKIFPDKKIVVAHWQMSWIELEKRIIAFKNKNMIYYCLQQL
jgi:transcription-repair coupling factor (superfamily II helicase)